MFRLKNVRLNFENCEEVLIDGKYIGKFKVQGIKEELVKDFDVISKRKVTHKFILEILTKENMELITLGFPGDEDKTPYERILEFKDIVSIDTSLIDDDTGNEESFHFDIHWVGDDIHNNEAQYIYVSKLGFLYIVICEELINKDKNLNDLEKVIDEIFGKDFIDDEEVMKRKLKI